MYSASVTITNYAPYLISFIKLISMFLIGFGAYHLIHAICRLVSDDNNNDEGDK